MLSPVRVIAGPVADTSTAAPVESRSSTPVKAAAPADLAAPPVSAARSNLLSLSGQLQIAHGSSVLAETIGALLQIPRGQDESLTDYATRLQGAVQMLSPQDQTDLQQVLNDLVKGISIRFLDQILGNPSGPDAAWLALSMEAAQSTDGDLAAKAALTSYQQNDELLPGPPSGGTGSQPANGLPQTSAAAQANGDAGGLASGASDRVQESETATTDVASARGGQTIRAEGNSLSGSARLPEQGGAGLSEPGAEPAVTGEIAQSRLDSAQGKTQPITPVATGTPAEQDLRSGTGLAKSPNQAASSGEDDLRAKGDVSVTNGAVETARATRGAMPPGAEVTTSLATATSGLPQAAGSAAEAIQLARSVVQQVTGLALTELLANMIEGGLTSDDAAASDQPTADLQQAPAAGTSSPGRADGIKDTISAGLMLVAGISDDALTPGAPGITTAVPRPGQSPVNDLLRGLVAGLAGDGMPTVAPAPQPAAQPAPAIGTHSSAAAPTMGGPNAADLADAAAVQLVRSSIQQHATTPEALRPDQAAAAMQMANAAPREGLGYPFVPYPLAEDEPRKERRRTMPVDAVDEDGSNPAGHDRGLAGGEDEGQASADGDGDETINEALDAERDDKGEASGSATRATTGRRVDHSSVAHDDADVGRLQMLARSGEKSDNDLGNRIYWRMADWS